MFRSYVKLKVGEQGAANILLAVTSIRWALLCSRPAPLSHTTQAPLYHSRTGVVGSGGEKSLFSESFER